MWTCRGALIARQRVTPAFSRESRHRGVVLTEGSFRMAPEAAPTLTLLPSQIPSKQERSMSRTSRARIAACAAAVATVVVAAPASAAPTTERTEFTSDAVYTDLCSFPLRIQDEGIFLTKTFTDKAGQVERIVVTSPLYKATLTNQVTRQSLRVNAPGPEFDTFYPDGSWTRAGTGPWTWGAFHPTTGEPGLFLIQGHFEIRFDAAGNRVSTTFNGHSTNLCTLLGG